MLQGRHSHSPQWITRAKECRSHCCKRKQFSHGIVPFLKFSRRGSLDKVPNNFKTELAVSVE